MERRNWSLKALEELTYVDSLEDSNRAQGIKRWALKYLNTTDVTDFDFNQKELLKFSELFHKNYHFLVEHKEEVLEELREINKLKKFLQR